jgi:hypothetical protein
MVESRSGGTRGRAAQPGPWMRSSVLDVPRRLGEPSARDEVVVDGLGVVELGSRAARSPRRSPAAGCRYPPGSAPVRSPSRASPARSPGAAPRRAREPRPPRPSSVRTSLSACAAAMRACAATCCTAARFCSTRAGRCRPEKSGIVSCTPICRFVALWPPNQSGAPFCCGVQRLRAEERQARQVLRSLGAQLGALRSSRVSSSWRRSERSRAPQPPRPRPRPRSTRPWPRRRRCEPRGCPGPRPRPLARARAWRASRPAAAPRRPRTPSSAARVRRAASAWPGPAAPAAPGCAAPPPAGARRTPRPCRRGRAPRLLERLRRTRASEVLGEPHRLLGEQRVEVGDAHAGGHLLRPRRADLLLQRRYRPAAPTPMKAEAWKSGCSTRSWLYPHVVRPEAHPDQLVLAGVRVQKRAGRKLTGTSRLRVYCVVRSTRGKTLLHASRTSAVRDSAQLQPRGLQLLVALQRHAHRVVQRERRLLRPQRRGAAHQTSSAARIPCPARAGPFPIDSCGPPRDLVVVRAPARSANDYGAGARRFHRGAGTVPRRSACRSVRRAGARSCDSRPGRGARRRPVER